MDENQESVLDSLSHADQAMDHTELIKENVFFGELSLQVILEGLKEQFENYINTEDKTNYVDAFFDQYRQSLRQIETEDSDDHPQERMEILDQILNEFISTVDEYFAKMLNITITAIDDGSSNIDEIEDVTRKLYEFFILNARTNFITALSGNISGRIPKAFKSNREYVKTIRGTLMEFSPIITTITVDEFLKYNSQDELIEMLENGQWSGNFLKKYSPKLYQNESLSADIITNVAIICDIREEMSNGNS